MRLLIDEMYPAAIAVQLRRRGHDVSAVTERSELRALIDDQIFATAQRERRVVVTENVADFVLLADAAEQRGEAHHGLVLVSPTRFPRGTKRTVGKMVVALDALVETYRDDKPSGLRVWL